MKFVILLATIFFSFSLYAQRKLSVIYELNNGRDGFSNTKQLLAINDSVAFSTIIFHRNRETKPSFPLGSGFESHNTYTNVNRNLVLFQSQPFDHPKYLVADTVEKMRWQLVNEEKNILGYDCKKAVIDNGQQRFTAWYATGLPFAFGPDGATNLPGLVLQLKNSHSVVVTAVKIENDSPEIIEPTKGEKISIEEFRKILKGMHD